MNFALAFWLLLFFQLIFGVGAYWPTGNRFGTYGLLGGNLLFWLLFLLIGWKLFGARF
jgi:hypothetical protein